MNNGAFEKKVEVSIYGKQIKVELIKRAVQRELLFFPLQFFINNY